MKPKFLHFSSSLRILLLGALLATSGELVSAQENLVAIGRVGPDGVLYNSANTVDGIVTTSRLALGSYEIILLAPNAFAGASPADFVLHATMANSASDDKIASAHVQTVAGDFVTLRVRVADVEDAADLDGPTAADGGFHFTLHRIHGSEIDADCRFVTAAGRVSADGVLLSAAHAEGYSLSSSRSSEGNYELILSRPDTFAEDEAFDYVLSLGVVAGFFNDAIIRGNPVVVASDDEVVFRVLLDDAQDDANPNLPVPKDRGFSFVIHRIPAGGVATGAPESRLVLALARVDGGTASLMQGGSSLPGATVTSQRNGGDGRYRVTIVAPGRFAGRHSTEFVALPQVQTNAFTDRFASVQVQIFDPNTMHLNVAVNDVEDSGTNMGVPTDASFAIALYDGRASHQADIKIGRGRALSKMRGNDRYRANAAGQRLRFKETPGKGVRYFHAVENDGNVTDRLVLRARERGRGLRVRHRRLTGGTANVTGALRGPGLELPTLAPGENLRFETRLRFRGSDLSRSARVTARANSFSGGQADASRATALRSR